jgi:hypothetical protein
MFITGGTGTGKSFFLSSVATNTQQQHQHCYTCTVSKISIKGGGARKGHCEARLDRLGVANNNRHNRDAAAIFRFCE